MVHSVHTHPADRHPVDAFIRRWGLACACIIGPVLLGIVANSYFVERVNSGSVFCAIARQLSFSLIGQASPTTVKFSPEETKSCDAAVAEHFPKAVLIPAPTPIAPAQAAPAAPSTATVAINTSGAGDKLPPQLSILANHIAGRLNVAYAYSFLALVSFAFVFGSG